MNQQQLQVLFQRAIHEQQKALSYGDTYAASVWQRESMEKWGELQKVTGCKERCHLCAAYVSHVCVYNS